MKYALLLLLFLLAACTTTSTSINTAQDTLSVEKGESVVSIRFIEDQPQPAQIVVKQGDLINLEIIYTTSKATENEEDVKAFVLDSYTTEQMAPGTTVYTSFIADETGTFNYGFEDSKSKGVMIVE